MYQKMFYMYQLRQNWMYEGVEQGIQWVSDVWPPNHQAPSEYVCVDKNGEKVRGGEADRNGKLFYQVEAVCGSLPCPPYKNGREMTCVVCPK